MCRGNDRIPGPYTLVHMNKQPGAHLTPSNWNGERFNWLEVLLAEDRLNYVVRQLEQLHDLPSPATTPPTVRRSIGPRLIAGFLQRTALGPRSWIAVNGMLDSEYGAEVRQELFDSIRNVDGRNKERAWGCRRAGCVSVLVPWARNRNRRCCAVLTPRPSGFRSGHVARTCLEWIRKTYRSDDFVRQRRPEDGCAHIKGLPTSVLVE